jgi:hypothetical protein
MILCDLCGQSKECLQKEIDGKEYDICSECWNPLAEKLKNNGRSSPEVEPESLLSLYSPGGFCCSCSRFFSSGVCGFCRWRWGGGAGFVSAGGLRVCSLGCGVCDRGAG